MKAVSKERIGSAHSFAMPDELVTSYNHQGTIEEFGASIGNKAPKAIMKNMILFSLLNHFSSRRNQAILGQILGLPR